jgi:cytoskeleton protein RodZ
MAGIGETLRRERLRRNLELQQIAEELKLSTRFLDAIENERFDRLPGGVFTKSFVRQYAHLLGLDEEEMAAEAARAAGLLADAPLPEPRTPIALTRFHGSPATWWDRVGDGGRIGWPSWLYGLALVVVMTLACSGAYEWWQRPRRPAANRAPQALAGRSVAPVSALPQPQPPAAPPVQFPVPDEAAETAQEPPPDAASEDVAATPTVRGAPEGPPSAAGADSGAPVRVQLTATETVWVRASADGKYVFSANLEANQTRTVDASGSVELLLGNAGGIEIQLNGKPIGAVGPRGQTRTVQLTSGGFKIVPPSKPAAAPL